MEVVYMDPNSPLPDRQYYGRVQLVEVRTEKRNGLLFFPESQKNAHMQNRCRNTKYWVTVRNINLITVDLKYKEHFLSLFTATMNLGFWFMTPNVSTSGLGILSDVALSIPSRANGVMLNQSLIEGDSLQPQTLLNRDGMNCYLFSWCLGTNLEWGVQHSGR